MNRAQQITQQIHEMYNVLYRHMPSYSSGTPFESSAHKATHSLVHTDAARVAKQHGDNLRLALKDKGLPKSHVNHVVSRASKDAYLKHYRKTYYSTFRAIQKDMKGE